MVTTAERQSAGPEEVCKLLPTAWETAEFLTCLSFWDISGQILGSSIPEDKHARKLEDFYSDYRTIVGSKLEWMTEGSQNWRKLDIARTTMRP